jgi:hypothetical protein
MTLEAVPGQQPITDKIVTPQWLLWFNSNRSLLNSALQNITGYISAGTNVSISGSGTFASPYVINSSGGASGLTIASTTITGGTDTRILYDNLGVVGEYSISGTGSVAMTNSPVFTTPNIGSATGSISGNAATATSAATLTTPRTIGGVSFDGSANIVPQTIQSVNEATDTTCFPLFITASGTQSLQPMNNANLTFNSSTGALGATTLGGTLTTAAQPNITSVGRLTNLDIQTAYIAVGQIIPAPNNTGLGVPGTSATTAGTATAIAITSTNMFTGAARIDYLTAAGAGSSAGVRNNQYLCLIGGASGEGGFKYVCKFGVEINVASSRAYVGLANDNGAPANVEPSSLTNVIICGWDTTDSTLQIMHNDAAGTCTKVDLGANFPTTTSATDLYRVEFTCAANGSSVDYYVIRLNTGHTASGTLSSNLPSNTTLLLGRHYINNGATAAAATLALILSWIGRPQ